MQKSIKCTELAPGRLNELCRGSQESRLKEIKNTHSLFLETRRKTLRK
jgi:hypothetical protein